MVPVAIALSAALATPPTELGDYLNTPDSSYSWRTAPAGDADHTLDLTSQTWHGFVWRHKLAIVHPKKLEHKGAAILVITGWVMNPKDMADLRNVADQAGMTAAILFDIPNQPIFGLREDDLIAETFTRYLETGDATWPLLYPMAKSALRAMDAVQDATKGGDNPIRKFVVTGESKRGWTTWFTAASGDKRVAGIAPMIFDNLNAAKQMPHQLELWGRYSDMIEDYTRRGLVGKTDTPRERRLATIIDPYSWRDRIKAPTLIVNGSNDPYWATDALSLYWDGLKQPKSVLCIPNAKHDLGDKTLAFSTLAAFARSCAGEFRWPSLSWSLSDNVLMVTAKGQTPSSCRIWLAESDTMDFRQSEFAVAVKASAESLSGSRVSLKLPPLGRNRAFFAELRFEVAGRPFSLCTRTWVERGNTASRAMSRH